MRDPLKTGFADRLSAAAEAKKAQLAKFRPKPTVTDPGFTDRAALRAAELQAVREARAAAKEAARQAAVDAEQATLDAKRGERKERKALSKAEAKAKRDARYAARKARR
jgi:hypothetical protein